MDEFEVPAPPPPDALGERGATFWREVMESAEFDPKETAALLEACRVLDTIDGLVTAVDDQGYTIAGSRGQLVVHPAVQEIRQQQLTFSRLVGLVRVPEEQEAQEKFHHARAKAGAAARWNRG